MLRRLQWVVDHLLWADPLRWVVHLLWADLLWVDHRLLWVDLLLWDWEDHLVWVVLLEPVDQEGNRRHQCS